MNNSESRKIKLSEAGVLGLQQATAGKSNRRIERVQLNKYTKMILNVGWMRLRALRLFYRHLSSRQNLLECVRYRK